MQIIEISLGEGAVGYVKKVKIEDNLYAIKQFNSRQGSNEYLIHQQLKHPNIVNFISGNKDYIITELMSPFCLFDFIKNAGSMSVNASNCILKQLVGGLKYMHQKRIAHRDVKLDNVLVDEQNYKIKLCDFDVSVSLDEGKVKNQVGTFDYLAPEINHYGEISALNLQECDIHSLGVLYFILLFGHPPFKQANKSSVYYRLIIENRWEEFWLHFQRRRTQQIPPHCLELIQGMIQNNPKNRFTLDEILNRIEPVNEIEYVNEMQKVHLKLKEIEREKGNFSFEN
ncbi:unnamed protein product (macronuclear) [Paramecium tetraurelia]|uniref:Protein kinase domain-containing protein n=1 Tax=Paramecium tetraurelia TaxID=5888 RepID=A0C624_PARTE|nr:uncharacterized protein GSPATT00035370001 [Paramecium tetraurelia]CAK66241.1 unnamed protein product [Paramecium tetraurelia]|eukprot:XP_001433638.1 hypothetical protein (macronuclear) [Paramecium tetraurelia strain d4-2]